MKQVQIDYCSPIEVEICIAEDRKIFLLGTAHVSEQSAQQTVEKIEQLQPDCVCVELDQQRYESLRQKERWQNLDLFKMLKEGKGFLLLTNLLLSSFQKRIGRDLKMKPGQEMIRAIELAEQQQIHLELVDRPVEVTLKRAWRSCNLWQRMKLLNGLLTSLFTDEEISESDIEGLKEADSLEHIMNEFADYLPSIKTCLIDERDVFLARSIAAAPGKNVFAVLGAGHLRGVCNVLERICSEEETASIPEREELLIQPPKSKLAKFLPWVIPGVAVAVMAAGFFFGDGEKALQGVGIWVLSHSVLAGLAALLVLAHPLSILVAALVSPFTALNPTVSVGLVTALVEVLLRQPRVGDLENLLELEKWWQFRQNRIWHALIIFFVVSMGGAAATFIALPWLSVVLST